MPLARCRRRATLRAIVAISLIDACRVCRCAYIIVMLPLMRCCCLRAPLVCFDVDAAMPPCRMRLVAPLPSRHADLPLADATLVLTVAVDAVCYSATMSLMLRRDAYAISRREPMLPQQAVTPFCHVITYEARHALLRYAVDAMRVARRCRYHTRCHYVTLR